MKLNNNSTVMDAIQKFREYIKEKGLRNTPERETIIDEIFSIHDHFDVDVQDHPPPHRQRID